MVCRTSAPEMGAGRAEEGSLWSELIGKLCELTTLHILFCLYNANYVIARDNEYYSVCISMTLYPVPFPVQVPVPVTGILLTCDQAFFFWRNAKVSQRKSRRSGKGREGMISG